MKVCLIAENMFGDKGPQYGAVGNAVSLINDESEVYLLCLFQEYTTMFYVPSHSLAYAGITEMEYEDQDVQRWSNAERDKILLNDFPMVPE